MSLVPRLCVPCTVLGAVLTMSAATAIAAEPVIHAGPSWQLIATALFGILLSLIGGYAKGISDRVDKLAEACADLKEMVLKDYHSKEDLRDILQALKDGIHRLEAAQHRRDSDE